MTGDRHAVVLGAGVAGLLMARVLSERFSRVTVLDRDTVHGVGPRRGVPQARHIHGLLDRGRTSIEQLLPGFTADMATRGATISEVLVETRWYAGGLRVAPTATGVTSVLATRPVLESVLRQRVLARPGIRLRECAAARGLLGDARRVTGVRVGVGGETVTVPADLVVDATGRASRAPEWLLDLGARPPHEERREVDLGYTSRLYRHRPGQLGGHNAVVVATGADGRGGGAIRVEGDRWQLTLTGMLGDHPPTDSRGFAEFAASLPTPDLSDIIAAGEPLEDAVPHRFRSSVRRRFDRLTAPAGFLVAGDALCSFNPLYAQGMTVAAQQALALRDCLPADDIDLPSRFYAAATECVTAAWQLASTADLAHAGVPGSRTLRTRLTNAYTARAHRAAHIDPQVARTFLRVVNLVDPPAALLRPRLAHRIMRCGGTSHTREARSRK
ncbi:FAD-dependent oxidoreductase [Nocardia sp. alder85J]|uniref:FAD-dependent oxidoreductase n=1 Tax=Nocardia sp. alder85J TaxID=2862949 RepID=UPI001CD50DB6|nr:FAD-dependent monooxygenase [Nocardia sp. alder85J]MCX4091586.1 FAD-dependent monooxygenase [Nocardia sp. alder85J]